MGIEHADVICPFYRYDNGFSRVVCEGFAEGSSLIQQFSRKQDFKQQMHVFCYRSCQSCEVFRMLMAMKYAD